MPHIWRVNSPQWATSSKMVSCRCPVHSSAGISASRKAQNTAPSPRRKRPPLLRFPQPPEKCQWNQNHGQSHELLFAHGGEQINQKRPHGKHQGQCMGKAALQQRCKKHRREHQHKQISNNRKHSVSSSVLWFARSPGLLHRPGRRLAAAPVDGQPKGHGGALAQLGGNVRRAVQCGHDLIHHRKADAAAAHRALSLEKFQLHVFQVVRRDATAFILNQHIHIFAVLQKVQRNGPAGQRILHRVIHHVDEHLPQPTRVRPDGQGQLRLLIHQMQPLGTDARFHEEGRIGKLRHQIQRAAVQLHTALQPGKAEQLLYHIIQPVGFPPDDGQTLAVVFILRIPDMSNGLHPAPDAGKRSAQLVADRRDEFILQTLGFGQLPRHLVDGIAQPANLVTVAAFGQTGAQIAPGDGIGGLGHLIQRAHNGADETTRRCPIR